MGLCILWIKAGALEEIQTWRKGLGYTEIGFNFRNVEFGLPLRYPKGDVEEAIGYIDLELRDEDWARDTHVYICIQVENEVVGVEGYPRREYRVQ